MPNDEVNIAKIVVGLSIGIAVALPVVYYVYRIIVKYAKPMCRVCQKTDNVKKYHDCDADVQDRIRKTFAFYEFKVGNLDETAICEKCRVIVDESFDDQGVVCRKCGTPMYQIDLNDLEPNALCCRPCGGVLTLVECPDTKLRISSLMK